MNELVYMHYPKSRTSGAAFCLGRDRTLIMGTKGELRAYLPRAGKISQISITTPPTSSSRTPLCSRPNPKDLPSRSLCRSDSSAKSHASLPTFRGAFALRENRAHYRKRGGMTRCPFRAALFYEKPGTAFGRNSASAPFFIHSVFYGLQFSRKGKLSLKGGGRV